MGRPRPIPTTPTEATVTMVWDTLATEATAWATPTTPWLLPLLLPAMPASPPPPPSTLLALPLLPPPPSLEATLLLDATSPTLPELSMLPRGRLRLMPRLTPTCCTVLTTVW